MVNPITKYILAGALTAGTSIIGLHHAAHGWIALENKAYAFISAQEDRLREQLLARLSPQDPNPTNEQALSDLIDSKASAAGLPPELVKALVEIESNWKVDAIRFEPKLMRGTTQEARMQASSHGLLQILGSNAKAGICPGVTSWSDLYNPAKNISCGIKILADAKAKTKNIKKALIAYNGGLRCATQVHCPAAENHANLVLSRFAESISR